MIVDFTFLVISCLTFVAAAGTILEVMLQEPGEAIPQLSELRSTSGQLNVTLHVTSVHIVGHEVDMITRAFSSGVPASTLVVYQGDQLSICVRNDLEGPSGPAAVNDYHHPNVTNLHTHGLHVSEASPSDNILTVAVQPKASYQYKYQIPADHSPGTYWYHPHWHGAETSQVASGAAGVLIVADPKNYLSEQLEALQEQVLVFQDFTRKTLEEAARKAGDRLFRIHEWGSEDKLVLVNGAQQPMIVARPGQWQRLRIVNAGNEAWLNLNFGAKCNVALLAKDGIYISDFPRIVRRVTVPTGGRADVVVQCKAGDHKISSLRNAHMGSEIDKEIDQTFGPVMATSQASIVGQVFSIRAEGVVASGLDTGELKPWAPPTTPAYLADTRSKASLACRCTTGMAEAGGFTGPPPFTENMKYNIQGRLFRGPDHYLNRWPADAVVERVLLGIEWHPFHQHTYPFQLIAPPAGDDYFKAGDWHDTYLNPMESTVWTNEGTHVRFNTVDFDGRLVLHCHDFVHADKGMMAVDWVGETCGCDLIPFSRHAWINFFLVAVGSCACCSCISLLFYWTLCKRKSKCLGGYEELPSE